MPEIPVDGYAVADFKEPFFSLVDFILPVQYIPATDTWFVDDSQQIIVDDSGQYLKDNNL